MFMCRWMNGDLSFVSARTKEDAIVMLDEWDTVEGAEISQIRDFMVDFRLNDEGDLELAEFGESCRDAILEKAYPRLLEAMTTVPRTTLTQLQERSRISRPNPLFDILSCAEKFQLRERRAGIVKRNTGAEHYAARAKILDEPADLVRQLRRKQRDVDDVVRRQPVVLPSKRRAHVPQPVH